jgi:hypothetical protein
VEKNFNRPFVNRKFTVHPQDFHKLPGRRVRAPTG